MIECIDGCKLCIFDLDGTLVNSAPSVCNAINVLRQTRKAPPLALHQIEALMCHTGENLVRGALGEFSSYSIEKDLSEFRSIYVNYQASKDDLYPNIQELLDRIKSSNIEIAICTNKPQKMSENIIEQCGISAYISCIVGGDSVSNAKPHPEHLFSVLRLTGFSAQDSIFIGDSPSDAQAAASADIRFVHANWGYGKIKR